MSRVVQANGDDHPEAAAKHLVDCTTLETQGRYDGAGYLSGYVVECCLKTLILVAGAPIAAMHLLNHLNNEALTLAAMPGSRTARYVPWHNAGHSIYHQVNGWKATLRYRPTGGIGAALAQQWVEEARFVFTRTVVRLRLDGMV